MTKFKHAMAVLETSKLHHERAIFRHIYNLSVITMPLSAISSKQAAAKAIDCIYTPFCTQPGTLRGFIFLSIKLFLLNESLINYRPGCYLYANGYLSCD